MKTPYLQLRAAVLILVCGFCSVTSSTAADTPKKIATPAALQVQVDVPPAWNPFVEEGAAASLASVLRTTFARRGFDGEITYLRPEEVVRPELPLLVLRLQEWRLNRMQNAECTFTATLSIGGQKHELGLFTGTRMTWIENSRRWTFSQAHKLADAYEKAADEAMRDLYSRMIGAGAVSGSKHTK